MFSTKHEKNTHVVHVLAEQVLQRLADGVALGHDAFAPVVARARRVGHEGGAADDALQALLQRRSETGLAERQRVQDDFILKQRNRTGYLYLIIALKIWENFVEYFFCAGPLSVFESSNFFLENMPRAISRQ